jgi:hypothetical protein
VEGVFKEMGAGVCGEAREWEDAAGLGEARSRWWWEDKEVAEVNTKGVKGHVNTDNEDLFPHIFLFTSLVVRVPCTISRKSRPRSSPTNYEIHAEYKCRPNTIVIIDVVM